jgi:hypothetical protein
MYKFLIRTVWLGCLLMAGGIPCVNAATESPPIAAPELGDTFIKKNYDDRSWQPPGKILFDPIELAENMQMPSKMARAKILGPSHDEAVRSLALKLWMIDNARYSIDMVYYIYQRDTVGYAVLASLCNAVKRGVDVRFMVDSLGRLQRPQIATHIKNPKFASCILRSMARWQFPKQGVDGAQGIYTMSFQ